MRAAIATWLLLAELLVTFTVTASSSSIAAAAETNGGPMGTTCDRTFEYKGKTLPCDSFTQQDGERLRNILSEVPDAVSELDRYQSGRKRLRKTAYFGTLGLLLMLAGPPLARRFTEGNQRDQLANVFLYSGLGILGGSVMYGITVLNSNEDHLYKAVDHYNQARPGTPITLKITAGWKF